MIKFNVCFVLGGPGAGKGTVCEKIVQDHGFTHLSAGELLRRASKDPNSTHCQEILQHMKAGSIVPAEITCGLLHEAMVEGYQSRQCKNYLIDGFPRNDDNRTCWESIMGTKTIVRRVIVLECPDEVCVQRCLTRGAGRIDDNLDTLKRRLQQFKDQCLPVIKYYDSIGLVSRIDSSKPMDEMCAQVKDVMISMNL